MTTGARTDVFAGTRAIEPLLPAAATVAAPVAGLSAVQAVVMSVLVYFPSVTLAALELLEAAGRPSAVTPGGGLPPPADRLAPRPPRRWR